MTDKYPENFATPCRNLNHFFAVYLKRLLNFKLRDKIQYLEVLKRGMDSKYVYCLKLAPLRLSGYFTRKIGSTRNKRDEIDTVKFYILPISSEEKKARNAA